jgi:hypothetical protein
MFYLMPLGGRELRNLIRGDGDDETSKKPAE